MSRLLPHILVVAFWMSPLFGPASSFIPLSVPQEHPAFDASDVHVSPFERFPMVNGGMLRGDRYALHQATMVDLISSAWNIDPADVLGGPSWLEMDRFDVIAKAPPATPPSTLRLMLRSLLEERFDLLVHNDNTSMSAFALTAVHPKMKRSDGDKRSSCEPEESATNQHPEATGSIAISCRDITMDRFAQFLADFTGTDLNKPVVDKTGLQGNFDFDLHWTPQNGLHQADGGGTSIFQAVSDQLGLNLVEHPITRRGLVVDRVNEIPSPNQPHVEKIVPPLSPAQFEVAVIRPTNPDNPRSVAGFSADRLDVQGMTLKSLIRFAWDLDPLDDGEIAGAPSWLDEDHFDIRAKASKVVSEDTHFRTPQVELEEIRQMLRTLLIDRFGMQFHTDERPIKAYTLRAVKPKLKPANPSSRAKCADGPPPGQNDPRPKSPILDRIFYCQNVTMTQFGQQLPMLARGYIYNPVLDTTGLKGSWDFSVSFSSPDRLEAGAEAPDRTSANGTSIPDPKASLSLFEAVRRQLGLALEKERRPERVLVIDHINRQPSPN
jgi:uncharacterized protein (TIGR03435 family)